MASTVSVPDVRQGPANARSAVQGNPALALALPASAGAWLLALLAQLSGEAGALHHHVLIEGELSMWVAVPAFLLAWQVMTAAMMLPASLPALKMFGATLPGRPGHALASFLVAYGSVWTAFGLAAFLGDVVVHEMVETSTWLGARPWLVEAGAIGLAGAYQFAPLKRRGLAACRHPVGAAPNGSSRELAIGLGLRHGLECVASSWALMLLMFAAGVANLGWMVALAALMAYETMGRHGPRAASAAGVTLLGLSCLVVLTGGAFGIGTR